MKILAWTFIILGILSLLIVFVDTANIRIYPPENFEDWWLDKKIRNKFLIKGIIDFAIAGWLFGKAKSRTLVVEPPTGGSLRGKNFKIDL